MHAIRARHAYDGESFLSAGATVLVEDGLIIGVESYGFQVPGDCLVTGHEGTLLPGLIDAHAHLVGDSGDSGLDLGSGGNQRQRVHRQSRGFDAGTVEALAVERARHSEAPCLPRQRCRGGNACTSTRRAENRDS